jgi:hypothetical protein
LQGQGNLPATSAWTFETGPLGEATCPDHDKVIVGEVSNGRMLFRIARQISRLFDKAEPDEQ